MPGRVGDIGLLFGAQGLACFYEMHLWRKRGHLHGAQCIGRQRASARSKLYIERMVLSPATYPNIRQPQANKLSEHLADFGSCREIACSAQWIAAVVIMGIRFGHIMGRSEEHTSELQSLMRISYAVFCLK